MLEQGVNVVLDRYVYSNMAFQGSKLKNELETLEFFSWVEKLEFELLELPKSDINILDKPSHKVKPNDFYNIADFTLIYEGLLSDYPMRHQLTYLKMAKA